MVMKGTGEVRREVGDPAWREQMRRYGEVVLTSPSGRYAVVMEDRGVSDPRLRFVVYGPMGRDRAIDVAATLTADVDGSGAGEGITFHVVPWASERDVR